MKHIFKFTLGLLVGLVFIIGVDKTYASEYTEFYFDTWIPDIFIRKDDGSKQLNQQARFIRRKSDNNVVYCVEHGILFNGNELYNSYTDDLESITGHDSEKLKKIKLAAYYGYGYADHTEEKWYAITQVVIWRILYPNLNITYTDYFKGNNIIKFVDEENELFNLIQNNLLLPDFDYDNKLKLGDTLNLTDKNNVLSGFEVENNEDIEIKKDNNTLIIKPKVAGNIKIKLYKKVNKYGVVPIIYVNPNSQNVMSIGDYDPLESYIDINVEEPPKEKEEEKEIITIEVPNTLSNNNLYIYSIILFICGIGLIYVQKKYK